MYFVTTKHPAYVFFCLTPSERGALGLTEARIVHVLARPSRDAAWQVVAEWPASEYPHTSFMVAWHRHDEPADPRDLLRVLPPALRERLGLGAPA